jgi:hypothetical protein
MRRGLRNRFSSIRAGNAPGLSSSALSRRAGYENGSILIEAEVRSLVRFTALSAARARNSAAKLVANIAPSMGGFERRDFQLEAHWRQLL